MADEYKVACRTTYQKPFWVGDPAADAWQGVMGGALDEVADQYRQARAVAYPRVPRDPESPQYACPSDALGLMAADRGGLERAPGEAEADWRQRLRDAWDIWRVAGTPLSAKMICGWVGLTTAKVLRRHEFSTPPEAGSLYVRGFAQTCLAQYDVLIEQPHRWTQRRWGDGSLWGEGTWGSTATEAEIAFLRRALRRHRAGGYTCTYLHVSFVQGRVWGAGKWGDGGVWGGTGDVLTIVVGEDHWAQRGLL